MLYKCCKFWQISPFMSFRVVTRKNIFNLECLWWKLKAFYTVEVVECQFCQFCQFCQYCQFCQFCRYCQFCQFCQVAAGPLTSSLSHLWISTSCNSVGRLSEWSWIVSVGRLHRRKKTILYHVAASKMFVIWAVGLSVYVTIWNCIGCQPVGCQIDSLSSLDHKTLFPNFEYVSFTYQLKECWISVD